jgi:hypothetical protein
VRPLPVPPAAETDPEALEMIRGWIIQGGLHISLAAWVWKDEPKTWGRMLAEAAGHLADAIAQDTGARRDLVFAKIRGSIIANLDDLPDSLDGEFFGKPQ